MALPLPLFKIGALVGATAIFGAFSTYRFSHAGQWLPPLPEKVSFWEVTEAPLPALTLELLGNPKATGANYHSPFGEVVSASLVAAGPFENYHDPTVCVTGGEYHLSERRNLPLDGPNSGKARAMIFASGENRILMYYWQQNRDGTTSPEARMGNYRDIAARLQTGYGAVVSGHQTVLVRIFTHIMPDDVDGVQAQKNVHEIARATYRSLQKSTSKNSEETS